jgi:peptidoglycan/LPS O-acetylase OafA/YrhL
MEDEGPARYRTRYRGSDTHQLLMFGRFRICEPFQQLFARLFSSRGESSHLELGEMSPNREALLQTAPRDREEAKVEPHLVAVAHDKAFSRWLDLFRWVAALSVVFAHAQNRLLIPIMDLPKWQRTTTFYAFAFAAGFAHQAVMIFFVLSGYLVGGGLWREAKKTKSIDLPKYLVKRVSRLCIVLYPAFLLIALLNGIGIVAFHATATGAYPAGTVHSMGPAGLVCNAAFLNTALCANYGADGALWSLFNEFWYYLVWPLLLLGALGTIYWKRALLFAMAAFILTILSLLEAPGGSLIGPYMLIWLLGVGVAWMPRPLVRSYAWSAALFIAGLFLVRAFVRRTSGELHPIGIFWVDLLVSGLFANLLITMKHKYDLRSPIGKDWNYALAAFSFSLYCIHVPVLNLCAAAMEYYGTAGKRLVPDHPWKWAFIFGCITLSCITAFLFSRVTEAHTAALRVWLLDFFRLDTKDRRLAICFSSQTDEPIAPGSASTR